MLYVFNDKIYIKPFHNKLVEVKIEKDKDEYNVITTNKNISLTSTAQLKELSQITLEEAYEHQGKSKKTKAKIEL